MATTAKPFVVTAQTRQLLKTYLCKILDYSKMRSDFFNRLDVIDEAYYRYTGALKTKDGTDLSRYGQQVCGNVLNKPVVNPIIISQVDSMVAYLGEVFLSGYPLFPVVANPDKREDAEALEGMIQDHLTLSESIPDLQLLLRDAVKYNLWALEADWEPIKTYTPYMDIIDLSSGASKNKEDIKHINSLNRLNLRNTHYDDRVEISKVDSEGDFAGYTKIYTRNNLKDLLNYLSNEKLLSDNSVVNSALGSGTEYNDWRDDPVVSDWTQTANRPGITNWDVFGGWTDTPEQSDGYKRSVACNDSGTYLVHKFYIRIIPSDFDMKIPNRNSVQVFKVRMVNRDSIISVEPYTGANGRLGIFFGQALEDGMELQTQSFAELATPIQNASTRLFNARFMAANRAIEDRALVNTDMIRMSDVNKPNPIAKIPVKANGLQDNVMDNAYKSIPFSWQGTEGLVQDAMTITSWASDLSGINKAQQGQFTKGNRTMYEFNSINSSAENRQRLVALVLEYRLFQKAKDQMKLNILQFGEDTIITSPRSNKPLQVSIEQLQQAGLQFEVSDGYTPKSKMANTDSLMAITNLIATSPILQQQMGSQLPAMIAQLATLMGVRGFDQFSQVAVQQWQEQMALMQQIQQMQMQLQAQLTQGQQQPNQGVQ